jgi:flagellar biosynthesis/type III secretory pathway chaperone
LRLQLARIVKVAKGGVMLTDASVKRNEYFDGLMDSLLSAVNKEVKSYKRLRLIIAEEYAILMKPSVDLLHYSNAQKDACISGLGNLEDERRGIVRKIADLLDKKAADINFTILFSYADDRRKAKLESLQKTLPPLIREITEANEKNKGLLDFSLSYIGSSMNFISSLLSAGASYESTGQLRPDNLDGRMVNSRG